MKPLFEVGKAVRLGEHEKDKRFVHIENAPATPDLDLINSRNIAVHEGNVAADQSLCYLGVLATFEDPIREDIRNRRQKAHLIEIFPTYHEHEGYYEQTCGLGQLYSQQSNMTINFKSYPGVLVNLRKGT